MNKNTPKPNKKACMKVLRDYAFQEQFFQKFNNPQPLSKSKINISDYPETNDL